MLSEKTIMQNGSAFIVTAFVFWGATALASLLLASAVLTRVSAGAAAVGIVSSALSFVCGISAGIGASAKRGGGALYSGLVAGAAIITALLSIGFLTEGSDISPDGVISVVSFTMSGCLLGSILQVNRKKPGKVKKKKKGRYNFT